MKAALDEQGFTAKNFKENRLVAWEESERVAMESILNSHGMSREDKQAHYTHMTVDEYKEKQDEKKVVELLKKSLQILCNMRHNGFLYFVLLLLSAVSPLLSAFSHLRFTNKDTTSFSEMVSSNLTKLLILSCTVFILICLS